MAKPQSMFKGKVGLQQRVLPSYRVPFFDALAAACESGLEIFAGQPRIGETIRSEKEPILADWVRAVNQHWLGGAFFLLRQPGLLEWLKGSWPDALILEANPRYIDNWRSIAWANEHNIPVIGWGLGAPKKDRFIDPMAWVWRSFLGQFDAMIAYSSRGAAEYRGAGVPEDRVFVAINAVVNAVAEIPEREPAMERQLRLLFVGRLQARKRVDRLLLACASLSEERLSLRIVGDGPDRERLERLAAEKFPRAEFTGTQRGVVLEESFHWADLFVLPGTGGLAVQQAMAHGLPVMVAQGDGTQVDLVRPENGWLVTGSSVVELAKTIDQAISDPTALPAMGKASAKIVRDEVNPEAMVQVFVKALRTVAGEIGR